MLIRFSGLQAPFLNSTFVVLENLSKKKRIFQPYLGLASLLHFKEFHFEKWERVKAQNFLQHNISENWWPVYWQPFIQMQKCTFKIHISNTFIENSSTTSTLCRNPKIWKMLILRSLLSQTFFEETNSVLIHSRIMWGFRVDRDH